MGAFLRVDLYLVSEPARPPTSPSRAGWPTEGGASRRVGKEVLELLLQSPALEATQAAYVLRRWTYLPRMADPLAQLVRHWRAAYPPVNSMAQPVPRGQTTCYTALSGLDDP